jgi:serine/threonine protein kinase
MSPFPLNESNETLGTSMSAGSCRHCSLLSQQWSDRFSGESSLPLLHGNKFLIISEKGEGSYGKVYEVFHRTDNRYYAVKKLKRQATTKKELAACFREVDVHTQVQSSPHVVRYYDSWVSDQYLHIQMELCQENLCKFLVGGYNSEERVLRVLAHICCALCTMHGLGFVHLDIKPENIYVHIDPCSRLPIFKIGDFGTARSTTDTEDVDDGTNLYLAPEILNPPPDQPYRQLEKADIFSLGVVIYEALSGVAMTSDCINRLRDGGGVPRLADRISDPVFALLQDMTHQDPSMRPSARDITGMPLIQSLFITSPELQPSLEISRSSHAPRPDHSPIISELRQDLLKSRCETLEARGVQAEVMQLLEERNAALSAALDTQRALVQLLQR